MNLGDDAVLRCSCGLSERYGIPCRHLFSLEDHYDIGDIDHRYQTAYSYYAWHPNHAEVTKAFKNRSIREHQGIRKKTLHIHTELPFLSVDSSYSIQDFICLYSSSVPICWNYSIAEYPESYQEQCLGTATGDFTQEEVIGDYDSDGVPIDVDNALVAMLDSNCEPIHVNNALVDMSDDIGSDEVNPSTPRLPTITDAQLLTKFKSVMNCHKSQPSKRALWQLLTDTEYKQKVDLIRQNPSLLANTNEEFSSLHLALDTSAESIQHAYSHSRNKKKRKNRMR